MKYNRETCQFEDGTYHLYDLFGINQNATDQEIINAANKAIQNLDKSVPSERGQINFRSNIEKKRAAIINGKLQLLNNREAYNRDLQKHLSDSPVSFEGIISSLRRNLPVKDLFPSFHINPEQTVQRISTIAEKSMSTFKAEWYYWIKTYPRKFAITDYHAGFIDTAIQVFLEQSNETKSFTAYKSIGDNEIYKREFSRITKKSGEKPLFSFPIGMWQTATDVRSERGTLGGTVGQSLWVTREYVNSDSVYLIYPKDFSPSELGKYSGIYVPPETDVFIGSLINIAEKVAFDVKERDGKMHIEKELHTITKYSLSNFPREELTIENLGLFGDAVREGGIQNHRTRYFTKQERSFPPMEHKPLGKKIEERFISRRKER